MIIVSSILASLFLSANVWAGGVSAGGMQAPARVECLFNDPASPLVPFNFMIYGNEAEESGVFVHVDLEVRQERSTISLPFLTRSEEAGLLTFDGRDPKSGSTLQVSIEKANPLSYSEYITEFAPLGGLDKVDFVVGGFGYPSKLTLSGRTYRGICVEGPLFHYLVD